MLTQSPSTMRIWMWTTKWQCWESFFIKIHFHLFVWNISIILNMILSVCQFSFTGYFFVFSLINDSVFLMHLIQLVVEFFSQTDIIVLCDIIH